jgi:hypothetical protein
VKARARTAVTTLALLVAAAGAALYAWYGVERRGEREKKEKEAEERLFAFEPAAVREAVVRAKGDATRLVKGERGWRIPDLDAEAEKAAVDSLLERVAHAKRRTEAAPAGADARALAAFGLAPPRAAVELELEGGSRATFQLGDKNPFDGTVFARAGEGPVVATAGDLEWWVDKSAFDLRDKRLLPFDDGEVARLEVRAKGKAYALSRQGGRWRLAAPIEGPADEAAAGRVAGALRGLRATEFLPAPAAGGDRALGLDRPAYVVTLVGGDKATRVLEIGEVPAAKGEAGPRPLRARLRGRREVASLAAGAAADLEQDFLALRDKTVLPFDRDQVKAVRSEAGGAVQWALERKAGGGGEAAEWSLTAPRAARAQSGRVSSLLWTLSTLRAARFADEEGKGAAERGLAPPQRVYVLLGDGGKELGRIEIGKEQGERVFVRGSSSPRISEVEKATLGLLPASADDLEDKPPAAPKGGAAPGKAEGK